MNKKKKLLKINDIEKVIKRNKEDLIDSIKSGEENEKERRIDRRDLIYMTVIISFVIMWSAVFTTFIISKELVNIEKELKGEDKVKEITTREIYNICYESCVYGFTTGKSNVISSDGFDREDCKEYCLN